MSTRARPNRVPATAGRVFGVLLFDNSPTMAPTTGQGSAERRRHQVFFYSSDDALAQGILDHMAPAFQPGHAAVAVMTADHLSTFRAHAQRKGFDLSMAEGSGQFVPLDAEEMLDRISVDGKPSRTRFRIVIPGLLRMIEQEHPHVHVYGEMGWLLGQQGNFEGALRLEQLWNEVGADQSFEFMCAYPESAFAGPKKQELHRALRDLHTHVRSA